MKNKRLKIIWLMPECPFPVNTGGRAGEWNRICELGKRNDIYLFTIIDSKEELVYRKDILTCCKEVNMHLRTKKISNVLKSIFEPYAAVSRWDKKMKKDIDECYKEHDIDFVVVDFPQMLGNLSNNIKNNARIIVNQHNTEYKCVKEIGDSKKSIIKGLPYYIMGKQLKTYEKKVYENYKVELYTFVSSEDKKFFEDRYKLNNTFLSPVGTRVEEYPNIVNSNKLSFIAKMAYPPNANGALWFVNNVWDEIVKNNTKAELFLVGKDPTNELIDLCKTKNNITVTGTVDSVEPYYENSCAIIMPIFNGGGVKVKLIEALGHGKLVISTEKVLEGTDVIKNKHVICSDDPKELASICLRVINNPNKYENIRENGYKLVKEKYSNEAIMKAYEDKLYELLSQ